MKVLKGSPISLQKVRNNKIGYNLLYSIAKSDIAFIDIMLSLYYYTVASPPDIGLNNPFHMRKLLVPLNIHEPLYYFQL